jgi:tripartite-type tricarboxylate transporter receptor subunit TctC
MQCARLEETMAGFGLARLVWAVTLVVSTGLGLQSAQAQSDYPTKPIRLVVGFAAGGGNDIFARLIGNKLQEKLGWTVVIENRAGAGGRIAAEFVAREPADGYTVLIGASGAMAIGPVIYKTGYDTLKSFIPVTMIGDYPLFLVVKADHPAKTVAELVAWTKANPDKANYASSSPAFTLPIELFKLRTGAQGTAIPFKSSGESILNIISGNSIMTIVDPPPAVPQVQGGKLRALAVTGSSRSPALPNVPTMTEAGVKGMNVALWSGLFVPAGTPKPIVDKLAREVRDVLLNTDVKEKLAALATAASGMPPEAFARHIDAEIRMWRSVVKEGNLKFGE